MNGAIININDNSGKTFIQNVIDNPPGLIEYAANAYGGQEYDFKVTNGENKNYVKDKDKYRGMPIQYYRKDGSKIFTSARDIGNIVAGYVGAINGMSRECLRSCCDALQFLQNGEIEEGKSSQNAQKFGYILGKRHLNKK